MTNAALFPPIVTLNDDFGRPSIRFETGPGEIPMAHIDHPLAKARVSLLGGQVIGYQPVGQDPVLWLSERSKYAVGSAIRGGIPVCWPWFGNHPTDDSLPSHGLVRYAPWRVTKTAESETGAVIDLAIQPTPEQMTLWPDSVTCSIRVSVGEKLRVALTARNQGNRTFEYSAALHSYFTVSDIEQIRVHGLDGCDYLDKVENFAPKRQDGPVTFSPNDADGEVDRVFLRTDETCRIEDAGMARTIHVAKQGSQTTVVWNPGPALADRMGDIQNGYRRMVCVETAKTADDTVTLAPGEAYTFATVIWVAK